MAMAGACPRERERREQLLQHLRTGSLGDVPRDLLREPWRDTRPHVRCVAKFLGTWQVHLKLFSWIELIRAFGGFLLGVVALLAALLSIPAALFSILGVDLISLGIVDLASLRVDLISLRTLWGSAPTTLAPPTWPKILFQAVLNILASVLVALPAFGLTLFLLGRLSCTRDALILDLNRLGCTLANGPRRVRWRDVIGVSPDRKAWIIVRLEDHAVLLARVPKADRDALVSIMGELIRHHDPDLHGLVPAPESDPDPE